MNRYPDKIIILKPIGGTPYNTPEWEQVYTGRCRCFLDRQSGYRINKIMDCSHQVVIPDRYMPEIGENFKVGIKMHTSKNNRYWDLVGHVKDFARYDRVCNLYFQMVKENLIYDDIPAPAIDLDERNLGSYEDEWFRFEGVGVINGSMVVEDEILAIEFKKRAVRDENDEAFNFNDVKFFSRNAVGDWVEDAIPSHFKVQYTEGFYDEKSKEYKHRGGSFGNLIYVLVPEFRRSGEVDPLVSDEDRSVIRLEVWSRPQAPDEPELQYETEIAILRKEALPEPVEDTEEGGE